MNIIDSFVEYVKIPTMSDPNSDTYREFNLDSGSLYNN